ncbi:ABC transporter permease [Saxibacter everestensis]|uniref:ABC transporter permease n=1 Tax=Saxibacter everestensis TaxID=2909229 RepID=A0ABY8QW82_9MICO|nr:ABC transporter permease [Brevibacteriaceae bacterium ZFBP1038]
MLNPFRSELTKALTLRSVQLTLLAAFIVPPALAFFSGLAFDPSHPASSSFPVESHGFEIAGFGQPIIILLAALITGTEYLNAQMRTTLTATPSRGRVFSAKLIVIALLSAITALISTTAAVLLKHAALGDHGLSLGQFTTDMAWNLLGVIINYTLINLIAASLTLLTRTYIATLVILVPMVLGLTISLVGAIPALRFLPDLAGLQLLTRYPGIGLLDPISGALVMIAWALLLGSAAWWFFRARDVGAS